MASFKKGILIITIKGPEHLVAVQRAIKDNGWVMLRSLVPRSVLYVSIQLDPSLNPDEQDDATLAARDIAALIPGVAGAELDLKATMSGAASGQE